MLLSFVRRYSLALLYQMFDSNQRAKLKNENKTDKSGKKGRMDNLNRSQLTR